MNQGTRTVGRGYVCAWLMLAVVGASRPVSAHPPIELQLQDLDQRIRERPEDAQLYMTRGEVHRIHQDWDAAERDYRRARELDPALPIDFALGRMKLEAAEPAEAQRLLDRFLEKNPDHAEALVSRARARAQLKQPLQAAGDFARALSILNGTSQELPAYYLERARALVSAGADRVDEALRGLDEGLDRLGHPVTLSLYAIELEVARGRYHAALGRLERIAAQSARKESWWMRRAEILEGARRPQEARQAYTEALAAIASLPASRRWNRAVQRLQEEAETALARLDAAEDQ